MSCEIRCINGMIRVDIGERDLDPLLGFFGTVITLPLDDHHINREAVRENTTLLTQALHAQQAIRTKPGSQVRRMIVAA